MHLNHSEAWFRSMLRHDTKVEHRDLGWASKTMDYLGQNRLALPALLGTAIWLEIWLVPPW